MSHAITVGDVVHVCGIAVGLLLLLLGIVIYMGGASEPTGNSKAGYVGCGTFALGALLLFLAVRAIL